MGGPFGDGIRKRHTMNTPMDILFDEKVIDAKVRELAALISKDYAGKELVLISILKGAVIFTADLMRRLTIPVTVEFIQVASYGTSMISTGEVVIQQDLETDLRGKQVLLIDTIVDSGKTMDALLKKIGAFSPAGLGIIALLDKKSRRTVDVKVNYCGFEIPDAFVVGYGMDFAERYRNLPAIMTLRPAA